MREELKTLRQQLEFRQYAEMCELAENLWQQSCDVNCLPLWLLALIHRAEEGECERHEVVQRMEHLAERLSLLDHHGCVDYAAVMIATYRFEEARQQLEPLVEAQPNDALALARLGYCHLVAGDVAAARTLLDRANTLESQRFPYLNVLAQICLQQADYVRAGEILAECYGLIEVQPERLPDSLPERARVFYHDACDQLQLSLWIKQGAYAYAEDWLAERHAEGDVDKFVSQLTMYAGKLAENDQHQQALEILRLYYKDYPHHTVFCLALSEHAQIQGHFLPALRVLERALQQDEENVLLWAQLSSLALHRLPQRAREAAEKAVELAYAQADAAISLQPPEVHKQQILRANIALAQLESDEQNFDRAEALYRQILDQNPYFVPALQGLGQQYLQLGRIDEALALFEQVKAIDPVKGHSSLIGARQFPEDEQTLENLAQAAQQPSLEGSVRSAILFQLAAAWEKRGAYDRAFEFVRLANESSKSFLNYDARVHRNQCARIRFAFNRALFEHRPAHGSDSELPIFVLGMPRSGTTLVEQILASHSQIFGAGELGVIPQITQGLNRWERHVGSGRQYPDCVDDITPEVANGVAEKALKELREYAPDAKHVVDKLPHNFEHIGLIKFLFPRARIISVRRDPRDIAISNYFTDYQAKHGGMGFAYDLTDIGQQLADHNLLMHHWHQVFPGEILEINYEDVVDDMEGSARRMLDYIGVGWEPGVLNYNELERPVKTASVWQVRQPVYKTSKARWKRYERYLAPLIQGTNAPIRSEPIEMITLPEAGFLTHGVELYEKEDLDGAELSFKKMLHHNPEHAACRFMVGLIYVRKGHLEEGIELMEQGLKAAPWHKNWRQDLAQAYKIAGQQDKLEALNRSFKLQGDEDDWNGEGLLVADNGPQIRIDNG